MANCNYPGCGKTLIGNEKHFCKSCKDKIKEGTWKGVKWTGGALLALIAFLPNVLELIKKDES